MKKVLLYHVCLGFSLSMLSQNLVPNPSFEEYYQCPHGQGEFYRLLNWGRIQTCINPTPDYFNACAGSGPQAGVPDNIVGTQWPEDGDGYVGFFQYGFDAREYITTQLISPLIAGVTYEVSFYLSLPERFVLASDNIGAFFTNEALECISPSVSLIEAEPQVTVGYFITSLTDWSLVTGTFVANGGEQHIAIGNFYSDANTATIVGNSGGDLPGRVFYYIDSVSVTSLLDVNENNVRDQLKVYPNPVYENIHIELENGNKLEKIEIYSPLGNLIKTNHPNQAKAFLNVSELSKGMFFMVVTDSESRAFTQKILKK